MSAAAAASLCTALIAAWIAVVFAVVPSATDAQPAALAAALPVVANQAHACVQMNVSANTTDFFPGGSVQVVVSCEIDFADLLVPGMPGHVAVQAEETAPIDPFRSVQ